MAKLINQLIIKYMKDIKNKAPYARKDETVAELYERVENETYDAVGKILNEIYEAEKSGKKLELKDLTE